MKITTNVVRTAIQIAELTVEVPNDATQEEIRQAFIDAAADYDFTGKTVDAEYSVAEFEDDSQVVTKTHADMEELTKALPALNALNPVRDVISQYYREKIDLVQELVQNHLKSFSIGKEQENLSRHERLYEMGKANNLQTIWSDSKVKVSDMHKPYPVAISKLHYDLYGNEMLITEFATQPSALDIWKAVDKFIQTYDPGHIFIEGVYSQFDKVFLATGS